jgi:hypothetical protein
MAPSLQTPVQQVIMRHQAWLDSAGGLLILSLVACASSSAPPPKAEVSASQGRYLTVSHSEEMTLDQVKRVCVVDGDEALEHAEDVLGGNGRSLAKGASEKSGAIYVKQYPLARQCLTRLKRKEFEAVVLKEDPGGYYEARLKQLGYHLLQ